MPAYNLYVCPDGHAHRLFYSWREHGYPASFTCPSLLTRSETCGKPMEFVPEAMYTDLLSETSGARDLDLDEPTRVSSIREMRQIEREAARRAANGEGQPLNFRALHQDRSNMDRNTLGSNDAQAAPRHTQRGERLSVGRGLPEGA